MERRIRKIVAASGCELVVPSVHSYSYLVGVGIVRPDTRSCPRLPTNPRSLLDLDHNSRHSTSLHDAMAMGDGSNVHIKSSMSLV